MLTVEGGDKEFVQAFDVKFLGKSLELRFKEKGKVVKMLFERE